MSGSHLADQLLQLDEVARVHDDPKTAGITDAGRFTSIVVALDLQANGDRALPVARSLADQGGIPVALVTVSSPHVDEGLDAFELRRRAAEYGWPEHCYTIVHSDHPAQAIVDFVQRRGNAVLVLATTAKPPIRGRLFGSVVDDVLGGIEQPVLLVGPHVPNEYHLKQPTLVACIDRTDLASAATPVITEWVATFGGLDTWVTEVIPNGRNAVAARDESVHVRHFAKLLADEGVTASWGVLYGDEPDVRLEEFGDRLPDPVFVATSRRWTDGRLHWRSTTRQLVRRSTHPVLVVPAK